MLVSDDEEAIPVTRESVRRAKQAAERERRAAHDEAGVLVDNHGRVVLPVRVDKRAASPKRSAAQSASSPQRKSGAGPSEQATAVTEL
jgi:hypothetical protein